jgi:hypothetical protein
MFNRAPRLLFDVERTSPVKKPALTRTEFAIVLVAMLVVAGALTFAMVLYVNRDNRWMRVASPVDEKAVEFMAVTRLLQPYVKTDAGNTYFCSGGEWDDSCRQVDISELPVSKIPGRWQTCQPQIPTLQPLPAEPVATLDVGQCQEGRTYARLVILEDGTIWKWQRNFSWVNGFAVVSALLWGLVLGGLIGAGIVWARRYLSAPVAGATDRARPV